MKQLIQRSLASGFLLGTSAAFALNPIQGLYGGLLGEVSHGNPNTAIEFLFPLNPTLPPNQQVMQLYTGSINYNTLGGGGGAVLGYRIQNFRVEGEVLYNRNSYERLTFDNYNCTLVSPNVGLPVPNGRCPISPSPQFNYGQLSFNGSTAVIYGLLNGYYDFMTYGDLANLVPYVGLGLGYAKAKSSQNFSIYDINNLAHRAEGYSVNSSGGAAQAIIGLSYYMDDYTWAGIDYRYLTTNTLHEFRGERYAINTLNFNVNFSFDNG